MPHARLLFSLIGFAVVCRANPPAGTAVLSPDAALARLMEGNGRFVAGKPQRPHQSEARRAELAKGQAPIAVVLTCSDSRVAPELVFDAGLGDFFVIRNAGNVLNDQVIGSIEYAVEHFGAPLVIVVGHERCGAVTAAVAVTAAGLKVPGHVASIVEAIVPAVKAAAAKPSGDAVDNAVQTHARQVCAALTRSEPTLAKAAREKKVKIVAARYDLDTGRIELLP